MARSHSKKRSRTRSKSGSQGRGARKEKGKRKRSTSSSDISSSPSRQTKHISPKNRPNLAYDKKEGKKEKSKMKRKRRKSSSSSSETSSETSSSTSSSSSCSSSSSSSDDSSDSDSGSSKRKARTKKKTKTHAKKKGKKKRMKKKTKKVKKKILKEKPRVVQCKLDTALPGPSLDQWQKEPLIDTGPVLTDEQKSRIQAMKPMTKEEWDARQSVIRRVVDPETGRTRLIKGDGEVLEEIVSQDRHKEINKQATKGDGLSFQMRSGMHQ